LYRYNHNFSSSEYSVENAYKNGIYISTDLSSICDWEYGNTDETHQEEKYIDKNQVYLLAGKEIYGANYCICVAPYCTRPC
jgi:hypothetical protein